MSATIARQPGRVRRRLNHLPAGLLGCGVVLVVAVIAGGVTRGAAGAVGAAIGVVGVAVSYAISGLSVAWADSINPQLVMPVGMAAYIVKFALIGMVLVETTGWQWDGRQPMAFAMLAAVLGWTAAHLWWITHAKIPYVDLEAP